MTFYDGENYVFLGGRKNEGDSNKICYVNLDEEPLDLAEFTVDTNTLAHERCLHKGIITDKFVVLVGGYELDKIEAIHKQWRTPLANIQQEFYLKFYKKIRSVHFNDFHLKKCSMA